MLKCKYFLSTFFYLTLKGFIQLHLQGCQLKRSRKPALGFEAEVGQESQRCVAKDTDVSGLDLNGKPGSVYFKFRVRLWGKKDGAIMHSLINVARTSPYESRFRVYLFSFSVFVKKLKRKSGRFGVFAAFARIFQGRTRCDA